MQHHAAGSPLRPYQRHAVQALGARLEQPGSRACLIAPPGAGKTRCALHVASELGLPLEVRVPTTALVSQWQDRAAQSLVAVDDAAGPPPVRVATYAAGQPFGTGALVVLDEAHHLLESWADEVEAALDGSHRVLGLTATPPEQSPGFQRFLALVGDDPVEIPAPPLVRDRHLAPYQELVWPVLARAHELVELARVDAKLGMLEESLQPELGLWENIQLTEDLEALTEARFARDEGLLVALCRRRLARGGDLPADLPPDPELSTAPTLEDRALVLAHFTDSRIRAPGALAPAQRAEASVRKGLEAAGFRLSKSGPVLTRDLAWRSLSGCGSRVAGCIEVLALEQRARGEGLRALVLTDRDREGDRISARQVLTALVADKRSEVLDPVLVTGSAFWIDDDLWPRIEERLDELSDGPPIAAWREAAGHHELDITGWSTAQRVAFATQLLHHGISRCLVGTRHLLGEGWDCPAVNVAIDLTGIVAPVTVNQVRGRAMRRDPADPSKVASLWEVLALAPGLPGGDRMLHRLQQRHEHTLGIDAAGRIRSGAARIDPLLTRDGATVAASALDLRAHMERRALDCGRVAGLWAVGQAYEDRRLWRVEGPAGLARAAPRVPTRPPHEDLVPAGQASVAATQGRTRAMVLATGATSLFLTVASVAALPLLGPAALVLALLTAAGGFGLGTWLRRRQALLADRRQAILQALWDALQALGPELAPLRVEGDRLWVDGSPEQSRRYAQAAAELLGPVRYPRYLLQEPDGSVWAVPAELGANRATADAFGRAWARRVGPCVVRWARQGRGRELLHAAWRAGHRPELDVVEDWV